MKVTYQEPTIKGAEGLVTVVMTQTEAREFLTHPAQAASKLSRTIGTTLPPIKRSI